MLFPSKPTPRWIIFSIDLIICLISVFIGYLLRFNFSIPAEEIITLPFVFSFVLGIRIVSFLLSKSYAGVIRYTSTKDAERIFYVVTSGSLVIGLSNIISYYFFIGEFLVPYSVVIIDYLVTIIALTGFRLLIKILYFEISNPKKAKNNVIIFGAGDAGVIAKRTLDRDAGTKYKVLAFIDDDKRKSGKRLEGVYIVSPDGLEGILEENEISQVIIAAQKLPSSRKQEIIDQCLKYNVRVLAVPPVRQWINGQLSFRQMKTVNIEDLLERDAIKLDEAKIKKQLGNKKVLVTGAAGSIGSELARQILKYSPSELILLDQAESPLYDLEMELSERHKAKSFTPVIGDVRNRARMENIIKTFAPEIIYHTAAYKHVPSMENNPSEAIRVNVQGTKIVADLSIKYGVKEFVLVSTDKAVNPTNVMGASKRIAEIYTQSLGKHENTTKFITTRFGNVLGSNGSVILRFKKQIEQGGPITVTDPEVSRYFMTIPEACQLVLEAGAMGKGGEIYIFDMGKSMKIDDLAKKMVKLSKLTLGKDIQLVYTGLRPGEKLIEELLNSEENTIPTHHPKIMIAKVREYYWENISAQTDQLVGLFDSQNNNNIVQTMKEMVPEYISSNSEYEVLDMKS